MTRTPNRTFYPLAILFASVFVTSLVSPRQEVAAGQPSPDFVVETAGTRAEVKISYPKRAVEVRVLDRDRLGLPDAIQISLINGEGKRTDLEMSAMDSGGFSSDLTNQRKYLGHIPAAYGSYVGVSLRIPFTRSPAPKTFNLGEKK